MTTVTAVSTNTWPTRSGRVITRAGDASYTAALVTPNSSSGTVLHLWTSPSPYSTWTDGGAALGNGGGAGYAADLGATDGSPGLDIDGPQASGHTATNNLAVIAPAGSITSGYDNDPYSATWSSGFGSFKLMNESDSWYITYDYAGPNDVVILPNGHVWYVGTDINSAPSAIYGNNNAVALLVALALTAVATSLVTTNANLGNAREVTGALTASSSPVVCDIAYRGTSSYTVYVIFNDGAGNLKYVSFADGTVLPSSLPTTNTLASSGVSDSQFESTTDTAGGLHVVASNGSGINYWYMAAGSTSFSGPYTVSSSSNDGQPTVTAFGSSDIVIVYRTKTGTTNKNNINYVWAAIGGTPTFSSVVAVYTDAGTNGAVYPSAERISADGTSLLVAFTTGTTSPYSVQALQATPTFSGGGTNYPVSMALTQATTLALKKGGLKALSLTQANTPVLTKAAVKALALTQGTALTLAAYYTRLVTLALTQATALTLKRTGTKVLSLTQANTVTFTKSTAKPLALAQGTSLALAKNASKSFAVTQATVLGLRKATTKAFLLTQATVLTLTKGATKALTLTQAASLTLSTLKSRLVAIALTQATSVGLTRAMTKTLPLTQVTAFVLTKSATKLLPVTQAATVTLAALKSRIVTIALTQATALGLTKSAAKAMTLAQASAPTLVKSVAKTLSLVQATVAALTALKSRIVTILLTQGTALSLTKSVTKSLSVSQGTVVSLTKRIVKGIALTQAANITLAKAISKTLSLVVSTLVTLAVSSGGGGLIVAPVARFTAAARNFTLTAVGRATTFTAAARNFFFTARKRP